MYDAKLRDNMFYCNYHYTLKDLKKDVLKYVHELGVFTKEDMKALGSAYDSKTPVTIATAASMSRVVCVVPT